MTDFFSLDVMDRDYESMTNAHVSRLEFLKGYIRNENLATLFLAVAEEQEVKDKLRAGVSTFQNDLFLSRQNHEADLAWVLGDLKGVLASWGNDEFHQAVTKNRVQSLVLALSEKIKEI